MAGVASGRSDLLHRHRQFNGYQHASERQEDVAWGEAKRNPRSETPNCRAPQGAQEQDPSY